jgi:hypothetical protein
MKGRDCAEDPQMWSGTRSRRTAEGAVLEMIVGTGVMVMRLHRRRCGAQFQQKRRPARRHEADRHVRSKQKHYQQETGQ